MTRLNMESLALVTMLSTAGIAAAQPALLRGFRFEAADGDPNRLIDVNNDGIADLAFAYNGASVFGALGWEARIASGDPAAQTRFAGGLDDDSSSVHARLRYGDTIGPALDMPFGFGVVAYEVAGAAIGSGDWQDQTSGFVGFSFQSISGETHYGWAHVKLRNADEPDSGVLLIDRIAYEQTPGAPIAAGDHGAGPQCNIADLAAPFQVLDLADVNEMVEQKLSGQLDLAEPFDVCDLADILAFVVNFRAGCF